MHYEPGRKVWIPCEVKPGPFSDERIIRIPAEEDWVAFVNVGALREPVVRGFSSVRAVIVKVLEGGRFSARVDGEPVTSSFFEGPLSKVEPFAAVQA